MVKNIKLFIFNLSTVFVILFVRKIKIYIIYIFLQHVIFLNICVENKLSKEHVNRVSIYIKMKVCVCVFVVIFYFLQKIK
jgi:hypothetical protein